MFKDGAIVYWPAELYRPWQGGIPKGFLAVLPGIPDWPSDHGLVSFDCPFCGESWDRRPTGERVVDERGSRSVLEYRCYSCGHLADDWGKTKRRPAIPEGFLMVLSGEAAT